MNYAKHWPPKREIVILINSWSNIIFLHVLWDCSDCARACKFVVLIARMSVGERGEWLCEYACMYLGQRL